jgi:hypothetical protein
LHRRYSATAATLRLDGFSYTDTMLERSQRLPELAVSLLIQAWMVEIQR